MCRYPTGNESDPSCPSVYGSTQDVDWLYFEFDIELEVDELCYRSMVRDANTLTLGLAW